MESLDLTDAELRRAYATAHKLQLLCDNAGEAEPRAHYAAVRRAIEREAKDRGISLSD